MTDWDDDEDDESWDAPDDRDQGPGKHDAHLMDDSLDADTLPCPDCGEPVWDQADACPHCGHWFTDDDRAATTRKPWIVATAVLLLIVMLLTLRAVGRVLP